MTTEAQAIDLPSLSDEAPTGQPLFSGAAAMPFLGSLKVRLTAQLGSTEISVAELTALQKGATLSLDRPLTCSPKDTSLPRAPWWL
jgi:flagellar motor switch/type III secretory pathway protein FliN